MERLKQLISKLSFHPRTAKDVENVEQIIENEYLKNDPNNIELLIRLALFKEIFLHDPIESMQLLDRVMELDKNNLQAPLLKAYIKARSWDGIIGEELFNKICKLKTEDTKYLSLIEIVKSWHYEEIKDYDLCQNALEKSIEYDKNFVKNYRDLAVIYLIKGRKNEAKQLLAQAIKNVKRDFDKRELVDYTDLEEYFGEFFTGTRLTKGSYDSIVDLYETGKDSFMIAMQEHINKKFNIK